MARRYRRGFALLALLAALFIAWGSLTPSGELPSNLPWDKLNHFIGYGGLAGLLGLASWRLAPALALTIGYGILMEYAQILVPGRFGGDWADILANSLGALVAVSALAMLRYWLHRHRNIADLS
ncbi:VanZ family protein [Pistricoccus aurantiacus]|uniref:VanZ family protein n=1 Tax=Pistricoccus aurantiacus TaxID=1883414 RepID=UPI003639C0C3